MREVELTESDFTAVGGQFVGAVPPIRDLLSRLASLHEEEGSSLRWVQLVDACAIAGANHVESAWRHAERARTEGRSRLKDEGAEFVLYLSGLDQLPAAL